MRAELIFLPVLLQILLTLGIYVRLGQVKEQAVRRGEVNQQRRALHEDAWPVEVLKVNNNIRNQFETPVLFYVLVICLWLLDGVGIAALLAAFAYVILRLGHAWVHLGTNVVRVRKRLFQASIITLFFLCGLTLFALLQGSR